jgi:hypothetical protein
MNHCTKSFIIYLIVFLSMSGTFAQSKGKVHGTIRNQYNEPQENVPIFTKSEGISTYSNAKGEYEITIPSDKQVKIIFKFFAIKDTTIIVSLKSGESLLVDIQVFTINEKLNPVDIIAKPLDGYVRINPQIRYNLPSPMGGAESIIKMYAGVSSINELTSQYSVRGGNYDENLIFVNDIQIFRPFLIRSGNQEGLSFVNMDLTQSVKFSAGGFTPEYGDKMSSVMDVEYKTPKKFAGSFSMGLLGGSAHIEGVVKDSAHKRDIFTYLIGTRFKSNAYLLNFLDTKGEYKPRFFDTQMLLNWNINEKLSLSFLGNFSVNQYLYIPQNRETLFGSLENVKKFVVYYEGQEVDQYQNYLGAFTLTYKKNKNTTYKAIASSYYAQEKETYDILSQYWLKDVEIDLGSDGESVVQETSTRGVGSYREHARNSINALISSIDLRAEYIIENHILNIGLKAQNEIIEDKTKEWTLYDSSGYIIPSIFLIPGEEVPLNDSSRIISFGDGNYLNSNNSLNTNRITGFVQDTWRINLDSSKLNINYGFRFHYWDFNREFTCSPRVNVMLIPKWNKNWTFWFKTGVYYQSPFYKELRKSDGSLNKDIKSQFSYQVLISADYDFVWWNRPFVFSSETYFKYMDQLISYKIDNVRIIYSGENDSKGYATGIDMKLSGEFIKGLESWITLSLMKTAQDFYNDYTTDSLGIQTEIGYVPRPSDQRFGLNLFFQDHIPQYPNLRVHLNFVFSSGIPFIAPNSSSAEDYFRSPWYKRVDLGFSYIFIQSNRDKKQDHWKFLNNVNNAAVYLEIFNLFDISNVSSYSWVPDLTGNLYAIPNYLTPRLINLKFVLDF